MRRIAVLSAVGGNRAACHAALVPMVGIVMAPCGRPIVRVIRHGGYGTGITAVITGGVRDVVVGVHAITVLFAVFRNGTAVCLARMPVVDGAAVPVLRPAVGMFWKARGLVRSMWM